MTSYPVGARMAFVASTGGGRGDLALSRSGSCGWARSSRRRAAPEGPGRACRCRKLCRRSVAAAASGWGFLSAFLRRACAPFLEQVVNDAAPPVARRLRLVWRPPWGDGAHLRPLLGLEFVEPESR